MTNRYISNLYDKIIPKNTFLGKYLEMMSCLETPRAFDFWSGVWVLSSLINRRCFIDRPSIPLFMNFYIIFVADSGICRKSTAVSIAQNILDQIIADESITMINSSTKPYSLYMMLSDRTAKQLPNNICINIPEFITFFKYKDMLNVFSDLYDCPHKRRGYNGKNSYEFRNVFTNLLSASTPNNYFSVLSEEQLGSGFNSRTIMLPTNEPKKKIGQIDESFREKRERVIEACKEILQKDFVSIAFDKYATRSFKAIYRRTKYGTGIVGAQNTRDPEFATKLSGILAINRGSAQIEEQDIKNAFKIIQKQRKIVQTYMKTAVFEHNESEFENSINRIRKYLIQAGESGLKHSELYNKIRTKLSKDDFSIIMTIMHELGLVDKYMYRNNTAYIYIANEKTVSFDVCDVCKQIESYQR